MRAVRVALSRACNQACAFCEVADDLDARPVAATDVRAAIDAAHAAGAGEIVFTGGEPTLSAHLLKAIGYARGLGLRTTISTNGRLLADPERMGRVVAAGLDAVHLGLHGATAATHDALVGGDPLAQTQALAAIEACAGRFETTIRTVLTARNASELPALIALASGVGARFDLRRLRPVGAARHHVDLALDPQATLAAWKVAWTRCRALDVAFTWSGFDALGLLDAPAPTLPAVLDDVRRAQLAAGLVDRDLLGGLAVPDDDGLRWLATTLRVPLHEVGHVAAARRLPLLGLPAALGGIAEDAPAPAVLGPIEPIERPTSWRGASSFAIVVDGTADALTARSTLPGLHHELLARGARSTLHTLFRAPTDPRTIPPLPAPGALGRLAGLLRASDDRPLHPGDADVAAADARWRQRLDLGDVEVVVVGSTRGAALLRPRLPKGARLVVLDPELLEGFDGALGDDDVLVSPFPAAARTYVVSGVPLRQVAWAPLPTHLPHVATRDPTASRTVLLAGGDALDVDLVRRAWPADAALRLLRLDADLPLGEPVPTDPAARLAAIGAARLVWMPVRTALSPAVARAASLALAAGRPIVASETPLVADHVRPGEARLLRHDVDAHRDALRVLAADDVALRALCPSDARRAVAGTARLAEALHLGAPKSRVHPWFPGAGPWGSW